MNDYPDIEKNCPAWAELGGYIPSMEIDIDEGIEDKTVFNPEWLTGLAQFVRAVVREMDRETVLTCYTDPGNATPPDLAERLAEEAAEALGENDGRLTGLEILLPLFQRAVRGEG